MNQDLLKLRRRMKKRKPDFIRQDTHKKKRLEVKWRRPKGLHSKLRWQRKGHRKIVSKGYKSPKEVRGLHHSGLSGILVGSVDGLKGIKKDMEGAIISGRVGLKKRVEIIKEAEKTGIRVLNIKDNKEFLKNSEEAMKKRKEERMKKKKGKVVKEKEKAKKAEEKEKTLEKKVEKSEEEIKIEQKKELDKLLTKGE